MENFDLRKYLAEGRLYENTDEEIKVILTKSYPGAYSEDDFKEIINLYNTKYRDYKDSYGKLDGVEQAAFKFNYANNRDIETGMKAGSKSSTSIDFPEMEDEFEGAMSSMSISKEEYLQDIIDASADEIVSDSYFEIKNAVEQKIYSKNEAVKLAKEWARKKLSTLAEGRLLKEDVSSRFVEKYLSMVKPEDFEDIEDIESYSDRDKAIFSYLEIDPGIMVSDELARDLKDKPSEEIVQYFKDRNYSYMPYSAMDKIFGSITPTGMEFERGAPDKVHLDRTHNMRINKILRNKYSDVIDFMKSDRTGGNEIEVHNAIQDRYSDEAKDGRSREVSYEEYASDFADAIRDRM